MNIDADLLKSEIKYAETVSRNYPEREAHVFVAVLTAGLITQLPGWLARVRHRAQSGPQTLSPA